MFTYIPEDKVLLTCDAFGCHYSEYDAKGIDGEGYLDSAKLYYDCIVKPYAKYVLDAVNKVVELGLDFDTILTSHGPILSERPMEQVTRYVEWSKAALEETNKGEMAIFYLSAYTNTFDMAKKIQQGALSQDVKVKLYDLEKLSLEEMHKAVLNAKVVLVGSPTINKTMVKPMWDLFSSIDPMANKGTIAGVFGSYGWSGEGISMAENLFKAMSFKLPQPALKKKFFPSDDTFKECFDYGVEFAQYIK
ncbi:MAG: flavodoxin domain-containing protein, partial [Clostridium sp.]|nr:flavodoxin domain-containing protein [Clostridium sp.]